MSLFVHLITYNGAKYIPYLFDSLRAQTFRDWELLVIDNASTDDTVAAVQKELLNFPVPARIIVNQLNNGFAGGHNQAYTQTHSEFFLILNQDTFLESDCLEKLTNFMQANTKAATVAPRVMRWNFPEMQGSTLVDSLGFKVFRNRRVFDTVNQPIIQSTNNLNVFGVSGAVALVRRAAVESYGYLFDEELVSYKEDVDLAFRLQSAGWQAYVVTEAVAYHDRTGNGADRAGDTAAADNKLKQNEYVRYHSYKNHLATLYKNENWQNFALDFPWIIWYELKKFVWFLLFDRSVLRGLGELWRMRRELKIKRKQNLELRKISWKEMRKWWRV